MGDDERTMLVFLVFLIPVLLMAFALLMERVEERMKNATVSEHDVEEFLEQAQPEEVNTFITQGWTRALATFRRRGPQQARPRRPDTMSAGGVTAPDASEGPTPDASGHVR